MTSTQKKTSTISIIVPTLNEAANLHLLKSAAAKVSECIVVDSGSTDGTVATAQDLGFRILEETGSGGRGMQLNTGASAASSQILLFLHADTILPPDFPSAVQQCLEDRNISLGAFSLQVDGGSFLLDWIAGFANLRSRFLNLPYGDQSLFMRKDDFQRMGGFPEVAIMEDFRLVKEAGKLGKIQTLPQKVTTSARRWQRLGPIQTTIINQLVILGYYLGISPEKLAAFYRKK